MSASVRRILLSPVLLATMLAGCGGGGGYGSDGGGGGPPTYTVGGTVTGLNGTVVLRNNSADDLTVSANGAFAFRTEVAGGSAYNVTVPTHPSGPAQHCIVTNGSGTATANVSNVAITCVTLGFAQLQADAGVRSATLSWLSPNSAASFDLYVSSARNCDVKNFASCPDGARFVNVTSPHTVGELRNDQAYFFRIETVHANGARGLSNEAGARPNVLAFNGDVKALAPAANGGAYLGGDFTEVAIAVGSAAPLDPSTGRFVAPDFPIVDGIVHAVASDGAGGWYLGGAFSRVGSVAIDNFAHILADGTVDPAFVLQALIANDGRFDGDVRALTVSGSTVFIGGSFTRIGGLTGTEQRDHLAAFNASGELLPWSPSADGDVFALATAGDMVYAGGSFLHVNGKEHRGLAAINVAGDLVAERAPHVSGTVFALAVSGNTIFVGGSFSGMEDAGARRGLGAFSAEDGKLLTTWIPRATHADGFTEARVLALAVSGNTVFVGGDFSRMNDTERHGLAAVEADGIARLQTSWAPDTDAVVSTLAVSGGTIYAGGSFTQVAGGERKHLAAIDVNGTLLPWNPSANSDARTLAVAGGTVYAGGAFTGLQSTTRRRLAQVDAAGVLLPWNPSADLTVRALAVADDKVYAGGEFINVNGQPRNHLAAFDASGTLLPWASLGADQNVLALQVLNGIVYVGGQFTHIRTPLGDIARFRLAALRTDDAGSLTDWSPILNGTVRTLAVSGSTIYAGGEFTAITQFGTAFTTLRLVGIDAEIDDITGEVITVKTPRVGGGAVSELAVSGGVVHVGGTFDTMGNDVSSLTSRLRLGAFAAAGSPSQGDLLPWNPSPDLADDISEVSALAASGGTVYAAATFTNIDNERRDRLVAIASEGELLPWDANVDGPVLALLPSGSTVYVGGSFSVLGESLRPHFGTVAAAVRP